MKNLYQVVKEPIITEKSTTQAMQANKYTFKVDKKASKGEIKHAVEKLFGVTALDVKTMNVKGKGVRSDWKKAIVTLKEGDKIELFEVGG